MPVSLFAKILARRGNKSQLPAEASSGELLAVLDTGEIYAGQGTGQPVTQIGASIRHVIASLPSHYERDVKWQAKSTSERTKLLSPTYLTININNSGYLLAAQQEIDINQASAWDSVAIDYTVAANRAGKDFYIYACEPANGTTPVFVISANSTVPAGYIAPNSRKVGGFHCLCLDVGTISGHTLTGYITGDILPASVWDLNHRPVSNPEGMVYSEQANIWVDIYLQSGTGSSTVSVFNGVITDSRTWMDFVDDLAAVKKKLLDDIEFQIIAEGSNQRTNIQGSADPNTTGGHVDTSGRRMISNIGCEDCAGAMNQWLRNQLYRFDPDGTVQDSGTGVTVYHASSPGGNQIYMKYNNGIPYLCCDMANTAADKVVTFGSSYNLIIKHDANANTGLPVYVKDNATNPGKLLMNNTIISANEFTRLSNPQFAVQCVHDANAATNGRALYYNDSASNRLEANNIGAANTTVTAASLSPNWSWYVLPGNKGSMYRQGTYGAAVLLAGGSWNTGSPCGSRCRYAANSRWATNASIGGRGRAEPLRGA